MQIKSTSSIATNVGTTVLLYGESGVGKTYIARTCEAPLVLDLEGGTRSLADVSIDYLSINTVEEWLEVRAWLANSAESQRYRTIYIDSVSELAEKYLARNLLADGKQQHGLQAYGQMGQQIMENFWFLKGLSQFDVIMTARSAQQIDETGGRFYDFVMPGKSLSSNFVYYFDNLWALRIEREKDQYFRVLQTQTDKLYVAKTRGGWAVNQYEPANLRKLLQKLKGGKKDE